MKKLLMLTAIVMIAGWSVAQAQQEEPKLKPTVSPPTPEARKDLLLEIVYNPQLSPGYCTVDGPEETPKWIWVTRFVRTPGYRLPHGELPIGAVKLECQYNGETADVRLTLLRGVKGFEKEQLVKAYKVGLDEEKTLDELTPFGIEPFNIKLIATVPPIPPPPSFNNLTKSVEIVTVESHNMPRPAYTITFRNLSEKSISALQVDLTTDGRRGVSAMFQGEEGRALIEPGGVSQQYLSVMVQGRMTTDAAMSNTINIRSAVFSDLTFEGETGTACTFEMFTMGRRVWLRNVLALIDQEIPRLDRDHIEAAKQFKERLTALSYSLDENEQKQTSVVSPKCAPPSRGASIATQGPKLQLLRDLDRIIETRPAPPVNFKAWLIQKRTAYQAWLARL